jgi:hypothetical protein
VFIVSPPFFPKIFPKQKNFYRKCVEVIVSGFTGTAEGEPHRQEIKNIVSQRNGQVNE